VILDIQRIEYQCADVGNTEYVRRNMREIIAASDLHIHSNVNQPHIIEFCDMVRRKRPQILVLVGDVASAWDDSWDNIRKTKEWISLVNLFEERYHSKLPLVNYYIKGDEDYAVKREYIPYCHIFDRSVATDHLCFIHGWQFDVLWESIHNVAYWMAINHPDWAIKFWKLFKNHWIKRTRYGASPDAEFRRKWWVHVAYMHYRATKFALENNIRLIIGHTHTPSSYGGWLFDAGSLAENKTYIEVDSKGEVFIVEIK